jgi:hypothetical protein
MTEKKNIFKCSRKIDKI